MHTYEKLAIDGDRPSIESYRFRCAEDFVAYASVDHSIGRSTLPGVFHLDDDGRPTCCSRTSSLCSLQRWAYDPYPLLRSREEGLLGGGCGSNWLIVESRPRSRTDGDTVGPSDRAAFLRVQRRLARIGVRLVDALIFDDDCHWWSMHELTTGSTSWSTVDGRVA